MDIGWKKVGRVVGSVAPLLGRVLAGSAGGAAGQIVADLLGVKPKPEEILEALGKQGDSEKILIAAELQHRAQLHTLLLEASKAELAAATQATQMVNKTMREEMQADHWFYRSWRPLAGWCVMLAFFSVVVNALALVWLRPSSIVYLTNFLSSSTLLWTFAFGVVGVYVHKRSVDKQLQAGYPTPSLTEKAMDKSRKTLEDLF